MHSIVCASLLPEAKKLVSQGTAVICPCGHKEKFNPETDELIHTALIKDYPENNGIDYYAWLFKRNGKVYLSVEKDLVADDDDDDDDDADDD